MGAYSEAELTAAVDAAVRDLARHDFYYFVRYMFKKRRKFKWVGNWHHKAICDALMKVYNGETKRLIINIPPRYSKTEIAVINFIAWTLGHHPDSEFIHISYSARLAANNSYQAKNLVATPEYGELFPGVVLASDSKARDEWRTTESGVVYATGSDGSITGYGAGKLRPKFGGAIIIDDPHKAVEAESDVMRQKVVENFATTIASRVNNPDTTPIIVIMQRLHESDLSGHLLSGANGEKWEHLCLPAISDDGEPLWASKHDLATLEQMQKSNPYVFAGQYQQRPAPLGGGIFRTDWWQWYKPNSERRYRRIICSWDTAFKAKEMNDFSCCTVWGESDNAYYLLDIWKQRVEAPDLKRMVVSIAAKWRPNAILIEDKGSGIQLIQDLKRETRLAVIAIDPGRKDKVERAQHITPYIEAGRVYLPEGHPEVAAFVLSHSQFPNGAHDDDVDSLTQALTYLARGHELHRLQIGGI